MAKKKAISKAKSAAQTSSAGTVDVVMESAHQIWLAGLGAFAKAQDEGGKIFEALVVEGKSLQGQTISAATSAVEDVKGNVEKKVNEAKSTATKSFDKIENVFEERVARALGALGVPTASEIKQLQKRIEELNKAVSELSTKKAPVKRKAAPKKVAAKKATTKPAVKKAAVKKAAPRKVIAKKEVAMKETVKKDAVTK